MAPADVDKKQRKRSFERIMPGVLEEMDELSQCDAEAHIIIQSPGDMKPRMWSSHAVTEQQLLQKKMANEEAKVAYQLEETKRSEDESAKQELSEKKKSFLRLMDKLFYKRKPLSDSDLREERRLLCRDGESLGDALERTTNVLEEIVSQIPKGIDFGPNRVRHVLNQESAFDIFMEINNMNSTGNNSNMGLLPNANPSSSNILLPHGKLGGLIDGNDVGYGMFPLCCIEDLNCESNHLLKPSPQGNSEGLISGNDSGSDGESDDSSKLSPQGNVGTSRGEGRDT